MKFIAKIVNKIKEISIGKPKPTTFGVPANHEELAERLARLERHYLVLLKEMLRKDGIQLLPPKHALGPSPRFTQTALQTPSNEVVNKGLNDNKPTIH